MINKKNILFLLLCIFNNSQPNYHTYTLITFLYNEKNEVRLNEYKSCIENNLNHPRIDSIHVLYDTSRDDEICSLHAFLQSKGITITYVSDRPTYSDCFSLANKLYPRKNIILSNSDIFFNETLDLLDSISLQNNFIALTRWNLTETGELVIHNCLYSQDTWIFSTPFNDFCQYPIQMGIPACDGKLIKQAKLAKIPTINPCLSIQCCHLHLSQLRHYPKVKFKWNEISCVKWSKLPN